MNSNMKYNYPKSFSAFTEYIENVCDNDKLSSCPTLIINGWWWKKYFKSYRKLSETLNDLYRYKWMHGGYEESIKCFNKIYNMYLDQMYLAAFPPLYTNDKINK